MPQLKARTFLIASLIPYLLYHVIAYWGTPSADLLAVWLAGVQFDGGSFGEIYAADAGQFTMQPPESWRTLMEERFNYTGAIYPYLYAPLWAWGASYFASFDFASIALVATVVNGCLLCGCAFLAAKITGLTRGSDYREVLGYPIYAFVVLAYTLPGLIASAENQPQVLVSFLLLLVVERHIAGGFAAAGAALALAASIKLYPALFALVWLVRGDWRALGSFLICGGSLGLASIYVAGWPLHVEFLDQVSLVSQTVLVTGVTYNIDTLLAQAAFKKDLVVQVGLAEVGEGDVPLLWMVMPRPTLWSVLSQAGGALTLGFCLWLFRRDKNQSLLPAHWLLIFTLPVLLMPLSWAYYFLPSLLLAPELLKLFRQRGPRLLLSVVFCQLAFWLPMNPIFEFAYFPRAVVPILGLLLLSGFAAYGIFRRQQHKRTPLSSPH